MQYVYESVATTIVFVHFLAGYTLDSHRELKHAFSDSVSPSKCGAGHTNQRYVSRTR